MKICIGLENNIPYINLSKDIVKQVRYYDIDTGIEGVENVTADIARKQYWGTLGNKLPLITRKHWELYNLCTIVRTDMEHNTPLYNLSWIGSSVRFDETNGLGINMMYRTYIHYLLACIENGHTDMYKIEGNIISLIVEYKIWVIKVSDISKFMRILMCG